MDIIAIILGLALTAFLVVSILLLLYRAEKRRKETKYVDRWQVDTQTRVSRDYYRPEKKNKRQIQKFGNGVPIHLFIYLFIYLFNCFHHDYNTKKD